MNISEFQDLMEEMFGECDRERGLPSSVAWLCEEVGELAQAIRKGTREQQLHELGDVLAWLTSLANQLDLSLTEAAQRYQDEADAAAKSADSDLTQSANATSQAVID